MTASEPKSQQSCASLNLATGPAIRFCCMVVVALALLGINERKASAQSGQTESRPAETKAISGSKAIESPRPVNAEGPATTELEDNFIFFPQGSATVDNIGKEKLQQHAECLKQNPKKVVTLIGSSDGQGSSSYNLAIAEERLMVVSHLLRTYGALPRQIRRNRAGSVKNQKRCVSADCQQQTHKVELLYSP